MVSSLEQVVFHCTPDVHLKQWDLDVTFGNLRILASAKQISFIHPYFYTKENAICETIGMTASSHPSWVVTGHALLAT